MTNQVRNAPVTGLIRSLPGVLHAEALRAPGRTVLTALDEKGEPVATLTASELDGAARSLAGDLLAAAAPGDRVLLPAMTGLRFQVAFLACLYARLVPVPVPAVRVPAARVGPTSRLSRLIAICNDVHPSVAVVPGSRVEELAAAWADDEALGGIRIVAAEPGSSTGPVSWPEEVSRDEIAFIQYTSGSTSVPRGVMITHGAMLANQAMLRERMDIRPSTAIVTWLPVYHDMGLCLGLLQPVYARASAVILEPETFVIHPLRWLQTISGLPDATSAAPDFAYAWCVKRVREEAKAGLDLSGWRLAINGAEPVRAQTLRAFHEAFACCGLSETTMTPAYGLAEATLLVTAGSGRSTPLVRRCDREALSRGLVQPIADTPKADTPKTAGSVEVVSCGRPGPGIRIAVVDPDTRLPCPPGVVGEIWVDSPANGLGYWNRPEESREIFRAMPADEPESPAGPWLRTGDLGFTGDGELFVTGRRKDLLVIHGANYYPQDFEQLVQQAHPSFHGEFAAACVTDDESRVTVVVETRNRSDAEGAMEAAAAAVRAVTAELPVATDVVVVPRGRLPRATSGKAQRQECARRLLEGHLPVIAQWPRGPRTPAFQAKETL
jgi:acyl-CoA synthetase (AMP-forming)/AMP-acid ligase II